MIRRGVVLLVLAAAGVVLATPAHAEEPQSFCIGFKGNDWYCVSDESGFVELPPVGSRVKELLPNG